MNIIKQINESIKRIYIYIRNIVVVQTDEEIRRELYESNLKRLVIIGPILFIAELLLLQFQELLLNTGEILKWFLVSNIFTYPILLYGRQKQNAMKESTIKVSYLIYTIAVLALGAGISLKALIYADFVHIYLIAVVAVSIFIVSSSLEHFILLFVTLSIYLILLPRFVADQRMHFIIQVNTIILNILSWVFGRIVYSSDVHDLINKRVLEKQNILLAELVRKDPMTGLLNHESAYEVIREEITKSWESGNPFSIILFDIDDFKYINNQFGHQGGDEVLIKLSKMLHDVVPEHHFVGRYGGDEFIIIIPNKVKEEARSIAELICSSARMLECTSPNLHITLSGGVEEFDMVRGVPLDIASSNIIAAADIKLFKAKEFGKNQYR